MGYNVNIPQVTDQILQSQKQILSNYQAISKLFFVNHYPLTRDKIFQGMHTVLTMQPQTDDPATDANQLALYNKLDGTSTSQLFFAPNNSQTSIQLTSSFINTTSTNAQQYTFVAGPFIIYGGKITNPTNGQVITLSPTSNLLYVGTTTANYTLGSLIQSTATIPTNVNTPMSNFTINFDTTGGTTTRDVYYLAIGQA